MANIYLEIENLNAEIIACRRCLRLVEWRERVALEKRKAYQEWEYWGKPVPGFGDPKAEILVVGLAPGAHGSNRTGRMFTGDASGDFLYPALHRAGFASLPKVTGKNDGLTLDRMYITATARCAPPGNKPEPGELDNCQGYLEQEIRLIKPRVIVCLGRIAFERILRILALPPTRFKFNHAAVYRIDADNEHAPSQQNETWLVCSYHPSQQNTSTGKLTTVMFDEIWSKAKALLVRNDPLPGKQPS